MVDDLERSDGVRIDWACDLINVCQAGLGDAFEGDPTCLASFGERLKRAAEAPMNQAEALYIGPWMVLLLERAGDTLHRRFHERFAPAQCRFAPASLYRHVWPNPESPLEQVVDAWRVRYSKWFNAHHALPPALRAKRLMHERFAESWTVPAIATAVGSNKTSLSEQFTNAFGLPVAEYLARVRMRQGLRRSRTSTETIDEVARKVGYQTDAKFSARVRRSTGLTPAQVRDLDDDDFEDLLAEQLALRAPPLIG